MSSIETCIVDGFIDGEVQWYVALLQHNTQLSHYLKRHDWIPQIMAPLQSINQRDLKYMNVLIQVPNISSFKFFVYIKKQNSTTVNQYFDVIYIREAVSNKTTVLQFSIDHHHDQLKFGFSMNHYMDAEITDVHFMYKIADRNAL